MAETFEQYIDRMLALAGTGDPLEGLSQTGPRIATLVASRSDGELRWAPAPDRWSVSEIVAHLADCEIVAAYRVRMILSTPGTPLQPFDQNAWARGTDYKTQDTFASLALFQALRRSLLTIFRGLGDEQLDRFGMHPERGKET